jgi:hypothetical protein
MTKGDLLLVIFGRIGLEVEEKRVVDRGGRCSFGRRIENEGILDKH